METGDILQILADAVSVFDANIKSFLSFGLEPGQIIGRAGYGTLLPVHLHLSVDVAYQLIHSVNWLSDCSLHRTGLWRTQHARYCPSNFPSRILGRQTCVFSRVPIL